ncbi:hypothetical protein [Streptomyces sp. MA5143a]|uniref:hypothetical protein n=1 Tax=Streptomyces sp. MA5143a TaxID=2083010 RepID=UPI000D1A98BB|nr:hypothetical protein [Streptomyces sp. MA5143a]
MRGGEATDAVVPGQGTHGAVIAALGPDGYDKVLTEGGRHDNPLTLALALDAATATVTGRDAPATTAPAR